MIGQHVDIAIALHEGVSIRGFERHRGAFVFDVVCDVPQLCTCSNCGFQSQFDVQLTREVQIVRDLDLLGQSSFWGYYLPKHRCRECGQSTKLLERFKRPDATYTYRFEQYVMETLVCSSVVLAARRLGVSPETIEQIVEQQLNDQRPISSTAPIASLAFDELNLERRRKLVVTMMSDHSHPNHPSVLVIIAGCGDEAVEKCCALLSLAQRQTVRTHRTVRNVATRRACEKWLPNSHLIVSKLLGRQSLHRAVDYTIEQQAASY